MKYPNEFKFNPPHVLRLSKPHYVLPEASVHLFKTFLSCHIENFNMSHAQHNLCSFLNIELSGKVDDLRALTALQTDNNTRTLGDRVF